MAEYLRSQTLTKIELSNLTNRNRLVWLPVLKLVKFANLDRKVMSNHNLTSIAISREVHSQLSKIGKMHQSYNDLVKTLLTEHWENINKNNIQVDSEEPAKTNLTNPSFNSIDTSSGVEYSQVG